MTEPAGETAVGEADGEGYDGRKGGSPLSHPQVRPVSLRLGHAAALTTIQVVIHYRVAASLPAQRGRKIKFILQQSGGGLFRGQRTFRHRLEYLYYTTVKGWMFALLSALWVDEQPIFRRHVGLLRFTATATTQNRRQRATCRSVLFRTFSFALKEKVHPLRWRARNAVCRKKSASLSRTARKTGAKKRNRSKNRRISSQIVFFNNNVLTNIKKPIII